jgi:hypothetical protein
MHSYDSSLIDICCCSVPNLLAEANTFEAIELECGIISLVLSIESVLKGTLRSSPKEFLSLSKD